MSTVYVANKSSVVPLRDTFTLTFRSDAAAPNPEWDSSLLTKGIHQSAYRFVIDPALNLSQKPPMTAYEVALKEITTPSQFLTIDPNDRVVISGKLTRDDEMYRYDVILPYGFYYTPREFCDAFTKKFQESYPTIAALVPKPITVSIDKVKTASIIVTIRHKTEDDRSYCWFSTDACKMTG
jgi:hypothetical protein